MSLSREPTLNWPPIIDGAKRSYFLVFRDILLTFIGWLILGDLLRDFWVLVYDWLKPPIFILAPEDAPDWVQLWHLYRPFTLASCLIIIGVISTAIWRRKIIIRTIEHYHLTHEDEAKLIQRQSGLLPAQIQEWSELRDVDVELDKNYKILKVINR